MTALLVCLGAGFGAPLRLLAGHFLDGRTPWGTLLVNLTGSAFLGWLLGHGVDGRPWALFGTGFCGAFTTYSAMAVQSVNRSRLAGTAYAVGTVVSGVAAAWAGYLLG